MARNHIDNVFRSPVATRAAAEQFFNFLETFDASGASGLVTVVDVYNRMRERRLSTHYMERYMKNTDPTTPAPTGKTNFDYIIYI